MLSPSTVGALITAFTLLASQSSFAQVDRKEFDALKTEVEQLREALGSHAEVLKHVLERLGSYRDGGEPPFQGASVDVYGGAFLGKPDAKVTIVEFSDYQCPFCARYSLNTFPRLVRDYIETGRVKYVFRDFPLESIHPQAFKAHEAVHCAGDQGKRREMHDRVFANQQALSDADLASYARSLGLDVARFQTCVAGGVHAPEIRRGLEVGHQAGVNGTPTFFLGLTESDGTQLKAVRRIVGAQPYSAFRAAIEELLSSR